MKQKMTGWQCHQLDHTQIICTSLQTDSHASTHRSIFTGRMQFLTPNRQCQKPWKQIRRNIFWMKKSTEDNTKHYWLHTLYWFAIYWSQPDFVLSVFHWVWHFSQSISKKKYFKWLEMWVNAQRDGRPAEYRLRPVFNAAVWSTPTSRVAYSNAAKTRNLLKFATTGWISAASGPKFAIL